MPKVLKVSRYGDFITVLKALDRMKRTLPEMTREGMRRWGYSLVDSLKIEAKLAGIQPFTGDLFSTGIRWEQRPRGNIGHLFMRLYGIYLDSMRPHGVSIHRRRTRLLAWAGQAQNPIIRKNAGRVEREELKNFYIWVKPHPFIAKGWNRARPKLRPFLGSRILRAVR